MARYIPTEAELEALGFVRENGKGLYTIGELDRRLIAYTDEDFSQWKIATEKRRDEIKNKYLGTIRIVVSSESLEETQKIVAELDKAESGSEVEQTLLDKVSNIFNGASLDIVSKQFLHDTVEAFNSYKERIG